jgi:hypothetical protein
MSIELDYPLEEYDKNGNVIYVRYNNGNIFRYKFDEFNRETFFENPDKFWSKSEYDEHDNVIGYRNSEGAWYKDIPGVMYEDNNGNYWDKDMGIENPYIDLIFDL